MAVFPQTTTYRDAKGQTAVMKLYVSAADAAAASAAGQNIITALNALTNAANNGSRGAFSSAPAANVYGTDAPYPTIEDKATFTFQTAVGSIHRYQLPAPLTAIFRPDDETVKSPNGAGDAQEILLNNLVTAMVGHACSRDGVLIDSWIGGVRQRRKMRRRFNIFTLNPDLTGPGE